MMEWCRETLDAKSTVASREGERNDAVHVLNLFGALYVDVRCGLVLCRDPGEKECPKPEAGHAMQ